MKQRPLALSLGDPAGIGPEIIVKAWAALRDTGPEFVVVGDLQSLSAASAAGSSIIRRVTGPDEAARCFADSLPVIDLPLLSPVVSGQPSSSSAQAVIRWIETVAGLALSGAVSGMVTAPIAKAPLYAAGFAFPGHTEFLAELVSTANYDGARGPVMMLASGDLRTALVTIHKPLAQAPGALTIEAIVNTGLVTAQALRHDFGIARPRLAMAGLNPHAGESGALGREEIDVIGPASRALRDLGVDCTDPRPADTLFHAEARATYDAAVCLYHDQVLIPVKTIERYQPVFDELGMPKPVVIENDPTPWFAALQELLTDHAAYEKESASSRQAALAFVAGLDAGAMECYLTELRPAEPARERSSVESLTPEKRALLLQRLHKRKMVP